MSGWLQHLRDEVVSAMKAEPVKANGHDDAAYLKAQAEKQADARRRLAAVDRRYREYQTGAKPT